MYLIAVVFPPLAVLLTGRPFQALLNLGLTMFFWVPGVIHAIMVVNENKADKRMVSKLRCKIRSEIDEKLQRSSKGA